MEVSIQDNVTDNLTNDSKDRASSSIIETKVQIFQNHTVNMNQLNVTPKQIRIYRKDQPRTENF